MSVCEGQCNSYCVRLTNTTIGCARNVGWIGGGGGCKDATGFVSFLYQKFIMHATNRVSIFVFINAKYC